MLGENAPVRFIDASEADAHGLDPNKFYALTFIINPKQNKAADPMPFKVAPSYLEALAKTTIGRPWIPIPPDPDKHVRGADNIAGILDYQKQYAAGEYVKVFVNPATGNAYGIAEVFPEMVPTIKAMGAAGKLLKNTSPLVAIRKQNDMGEITEGEILHVQGVRVPGYGAVAKVAGFCEGMLNKCMAELRTLGASGKLQEMREKTFNDKGFKHAPTDTPRLAMNDDDKAAVVQIVKDVLAAERTAGATGAGAQAAQEQKPATAPAAGADETADKPQGFDITKSAEYLAQASKLKELESWKANTEAEQAKNARMGQARTIAKAEAFRKEIAADKVEDRVKELFEMKGTDGKTLLDLTLTAQREEKALEKIAGASGFYEMPRMGAPAKPKEIGLDFEQAVGF